MRSAVTAIAWEFWSANRRGWLLVLALLPACALLYRLLLEPVERPDSDARFFSFLPMVLSLILAAAFCNFTDSHLRDGMAGFPRHLFAKPVRTWLAVACVMVCAMLSVVGLYVAWVKLVFQPMGVVIAIRWPATLMAAGTVFYQAIIWCLCGFRLTRVVTVSLAVTLLVGAGFLPTLLPATSIWASEAALSAALGVAVAVTYGATVAVVGIQRRGGARGRAWLQALVDSLASAIPQRRGPLRLKSADAALFWMEWRRTGFVLPVAVLLTTALILGPVLWFTGRGLQETLWAETWLAIMPMILAFPIGMGFGKPDFWSLDLSLPPFFATRPITADQLLAAKLKSAACSALAAWAALMFVAPLCIWLYCDTEHWHEAWQMMGVVYSPISRWVLPILGLVASFLLTWSLLVGSIWLGYSGHAWFYYSFVGVGMAALLTTIFYFIWWLDHPQHHGESAVQVMPWLPWALAFAVSTKLWCAVYFVHRIRRRGLVSNRSVLRYVVFWLAATACLMLYAMLLAPRVEWIRNLHLLAALAAIPIARLAVAPVTIAWNRHR